MEGGVKLKEGVDHAPSICANKLVIKNTELKLQSWIFLLLVSFEINPMEMVPTDMSSADKKTQG